MGLFSLFGLAQEGSDLQEVSEIIFSRKMISDTWLITENRGGGVKLTPTPVREPFARSAGSHGSIVITKARSDCGTLE